MNKVELENRTLEFSKNLIQIINKLPKNHATQRIEAQCVDSGTSIGANYREANAAESTKDFTHKINISFKEAKETKYWIELLLALNADFKSELSVLLKETDELMRIFGKAVTTCRQNAKMQNPK